MRNFLVTTALAAVHVTGAVAHVVVKHAFLEWVALSAGPIIVFGVVPA